MAFNEVILQGNLTRDPEIKDTAQTKLCKFQLAVTEKYNDKESTIYPDIIVWGAQAEACSKYLKKGSPALVSGKLKQERWKAQNGEEKSKFVVVSRQVVFLSTKERGAPMPLGKESIERMDPLTGQAEFNFDSLPF